MRTNNFEVPSEIFTWIENKAFENLTAVEKDTVLLHFTAEEYNDMNAAATLLKGTWSNTPGISGTAKNAIMQFYDQKHGSGKILNLFSRQVEIWKVAAVLSPVILGFLVFSIFRPDSTIVTQALAVTDTLYIKEKQIEQVLIHDTVFRRIVEKQAQSPSHKSENYQVNSEVSTDDSLGVLSINDLRSQANMVRGNSMEDDSLWRRFPQVSL